MMTVYLAMMLQSIILFFLMRVRKSKREITEGNEQKCATFRISLVTQDSINSFAGNQLREPFGDRRNRIMQLPPSKSTIKLSTKQSIVTSSRNLRDRTTAALSFSRLIKLQASDFSEVIALEIDRKLKFSPSKLECSQQLQKVLGLSQKMNEQLFSYHSIETKIGQLNEIVKLVGSSTLIYRAFAFSGYCLYEYGSYSLSLYYFDSALKSYYDRDHPGYYLFQRRLELRVYKFVSRIFLTKGQYQEAKGFAYKCLRKAWLLNDLDEEMSAYDLLGKIYVQLQSVSMSRYFHHRMAIGKHENAQILQMSRQQQQLEKQESEKVQFACHQTINVFIDKNSAFNDILENHYRMRSLQHSQEIGLLDNENRQVYLYTHRSPNRRLDNYHLLQRKMIEARASKELHFIRPKGGMRLRKLFTEFSAMLHEVRQNIQNTCFPSQFTLKTIKIPSKCEPVDEETL